MKHHQTTVTAGKFGVSITTETHQEGAVLNIYRILPGKIMRGEGDGKRFSSTDQAWKWALEHGHIERYYRRVWCLQHRCLHSFLGRPTPTFGICWRVGGEGAE